MVHDKGEEVKVELPDEMNLGEMLIDDRVKEGKGDKVAVKCVGNKELGIEPSEYTYREMMEYSNAVGNALMELGVEVDNRVLLVLPDSPEFVATFCGASKIGAVPVAVNTYLSPDDYLYFLNDSRAKVVVTHRIFFDKIASVIDKAKFLKAAVVVDHETKGNVYDFKEIVENASTKLEPVKLSKDAMGYWLYSSGTTGRPKGVVHLQHDPFYCVEGYYKMCLGLTENDVIYCVSKMFFAYGLTTNLFGPMLVGATSIYDPAPPDPERTLKIINDYKPTILATVPAFYSRLVTLDVSNYDLSSLRCAISGGEPLPEEIWYRFKEKFGVDIIEHIGMTEVQFAFIGNRIGKVKPGYTGVVAPGFEVKLVDEEGNEVEIGQEGRCLIKGDSVAAFYWEKHEKTKKAFLGEWFDTGDTFIRDEDGFYKYVGRADDLIKTLGLWVSPAEVEAELIKHPAVNMCAVVQGFDENKLEVVTAYIVLNEGYEPSKELESELQNFLRQQGLKGYKIPKKFVFVKELPMTATGKIQRYKLRQEEWKKAFGGG